MAASTSDLPFGSEFSPSVIDLTDLLDIIQLHQGDNVGLEDAIWTEYFTGHSKKESDPKKREYNQRKLANNVNLSIRAYGIVDTSAKFTAFGTELYSLRGDPAQLYAALARHILLNLNGMGFVQCLLDMVAAGQEINLDSLRQSLGERGIHFPKGGKHPSMMRLWLAKAGVISENGWQVNSIRLRTVLGTDPEDFPTLAALSSLQRAFLLALANTGIKTDQSSKAIVTIAEATYGVRFPDKSLPKDVLNGLVAAGFIEAKKTTGGRGAKPFLVKPTAKLEADIVGPLLEQLKDRISPRLLALLKKPLSEIVTEIDSTDRYIGGLALEALAFKLMRTLGMDYVSTRLRASSTGGAEVDLVFQSSRLVFSRWQIQCKNTARVSLDDVAKEVGLTHFLKSNVIVMVTTGTIGLEARRFANKTMSDSNLAIVMLDSADLKAIAASPAHLVEAFQREAEHAMSLKKMDLGAEEK
ncbi:MAG: restriction endonuclease [Mesorhizobium sp.]|uniref:restriction endonuclease n=1 Tax=Mesorhizobium sp. TaxID=1871066 RepID=UPI0011F562F9|nr:restriction endonuclease [Mesorhizobium sp.]TIT32639.1 MAG: restriction endonuclease [Mesorhizobium sp.]